MLTEGLDPERVRRLGPERLRALCARREVRVHRTKAVQVVEAARDALGLPPQVRAVHAKVLAADVALLGALDTAIGRADAELAEVLPRIPARILTTMPRVGSCGHPPTGPASATPLGSALRHRSSGCLGSPPGSTSRPGANAPTPASPGRERPSSAGPSSTWGPARRRAPPLPSDLATSPAAAAFGPRDEPSRRCLRKSHCSRILRACYWSG